MLRENKIQKLFKLLLSLTILTAFICVFFQFQDNFSESRRCISRGFSYTAAVVMNINRALNIMDEGSSQQEEGEERVSPVFFLNSGLLLNSMPVPAAFALLSALLFIKAGWYICSHRMGISRMKYYMQWYLKFLNPVQKSILRRLDQYDINPVRRIKREGNPCFVLKSEHGFFL